MVPFYTRFLEIAKKEARDMKESARTAAVWEPNRFVAVPSQSETKTGWAVKLPMGKPRPGAVW